MANKTQIHCPIGGVKEITVIREKVGLGKLQTLTEAKKRAISTYEWLKANLVPGKRVLLCTHKDAEDHYKGLAKDFKKDGFADFQVAHWGAVTGSNDWKLCDTVVVTSLPYRPHGWAAGALTTRLGITGGLSALRDESKDSAAKALANSKTAVDVIQLLYRCRIRRMVDVDGGSDAADLFLMIPNDYRGDDIVERVTAEMPGVNLKAWKFHGFSMTAAQAGRNSRTPPKGRSVGGWLSSLLVKLRPGPSGTVRTDSSPGWRSTSTGKSGCWIPKIHSADTSRT